MIMISSLSSAPPIGRCGVRGRRSDPNDSGPAQENPAQAQTLLEQCRDDGLATIHKETFRIDYLPYNRDTQMTLLIEDNKTADAVVNRMLEEGIEIVDKI